MMDAQNIYLLGIGGIGMSGLARYFNNAGRSVAGYDRTRTELCAALENEKISIHYEDNEALIPKGFKAKNTLVIYTPAIPPDHKEMAWLQKKGYTLKKRAWVLGQIAQKHTCLAVAGTHGKTTTSSLLAHLFRSAGHEITAFLGGISTNYGTNFWGNDENQILVAEADEYDRSFLNLKPAGAIVTSTDADHLDIYGNPEELNSTFQDFARSVSDTLIVREGLNLASRLRYGLEQATDYHAENIRVVAHSFVFDFHHPEGIVPAVKTQMPGRHNIENAVAAAALAMHFGLSADEVKAGIESFTGVKRRFEYHVKTNHTIYIDDYAHHPREIEALGRAVKNLYPEKKITVIFQPHLFSRTRDFMEGFAESLSLFDEVILMDIYPARERPIAGVHAKALLELIQAPEKVLLSKSEILEKYQNAKPEVILTVGAGDIDQLVQPLKVALLQ